MPVKRRVSKSREYPITPEAIEAFQIGDSLRLMRALGLKPWQHSPLDVGEWERPVWFDETDWELQQSLRTELEEAKCQ